MSESPQERIDAATTQPLMALMLDTIPDFSLIGLWDAIDRLPEIGPAARTPAKRAVQMIAENTKAIEEAKTSLREALSEWSDKELREAGLWLWPDFTRDAQDQRSEMESASIKIGLVPHGYQIDVEWNDGNRQCECRDYGGSIPAMQDAVYGIVGLVRELDNL